MPDCPEQPLGFYESAGEIELGRGDVISTIDLEEFPGDYPVYSSSATGAGEFGRYGRFMFDEELITWSIDGGGRPFYRLKHRYSITNVCGYLKIKRTDLWNYRYLHALLENLQSGIHFDYQTKAHPSVIRELYRFKRIPIDEQREIAKILETLDTSIEKYKALISKLKKVRAGMLHDLLTCGVDENGEIRDPNQCPKQFIDSQLGIIPKEWRVLAFGGACSSMIDGPFGSNLKSSHYVEGFGVRVIRLQNIGIGEFIDNDKAFISNEHAKVLCRHEVNSGDLLVASLGDENHPIARACIYPQVLESGINKADCFRVRMNPDLAINEFMGMLLNCPATRKGFFGMAQGVTRDRVNVTNLKNLLISLPPVAEQKMVVEYYQAINKDMEFQLISLSKLNLLKQGLMTDLLTGQTRIHPRLEFS